MLITVGYKNTYTEPAMALLMCHIQDNAGTMWQLTSSHLKIATILLEKDGFTWCAHHLPCLSEKNIFGKFLKGPNVEMETQTFQGKPTPINIGWHKQRNTANEATLI